MKVRLSDISNIKTGYSARERLDFASSLSHTRIILPKDISDEGKIDFKRTSGIEILSFRKFLLETGEVLLQSRGKFIAAIYDKPKGHRFIASSLLLRIILNSSDFLPEYIALYLNSEMGQSELNRLSGISAIKSITKSELSKLEVPVFPIDIQKKLVEYAETFNNWCELNKKQLVLQTDIFNNAINKIIRENNG